MLENITIVMFRLAVRNRRKTPTAASTVNRNRQPRNAVRLRLAVSVNRESPRLNRMNRKPELLSPSILDFPSLALSPVTSANEDNLGKLVATVEEDLAIAEKKFYFHPSPRTAARGEEPQQLSFFPVTSPRVSGSS